MNESNTGGPAFPGTQYANGVQPTGFSNGMTLRDYFAAKALQGLVITEANHRLKPDSWAQEAYMVADAMLRRRGT